MLFVLHSFKVMYQIYLSAYVEPSLPSHEEGLLDDKTESSEI
jgi:hypothetical protein